MRRFGKSVCVSYITTNKTKTTFLLINITPRTQTIVFYGMV